MSRREIVGAWVEEDGEIVEDAACEELAGS
jgi:hypothetical protein